MKLLHACSTHVDIQSRAGADGAVCSFRLAEENPGVRGTLHQLNKLNMHPRLNIANKAFFLLSLACGWKNLDYQFQACMTSRWIEWIYRMH